MKKIIILILLLSNISFVFSQGQEQETASLDVLVAPTSPGFILLGVEPTSIERPTNLIDFNISIRNATNGFTTIPSSYAIEFAPFWVCNGKNIDYKDYIGNNIWHNIKQTLSISLATTTIENEITNVDNTRSGIGLKFSILRGKMNNEFQTKSKINDSLRKTTAQEVAKIVSQGISPETAQVLATQKEEELKKKLISNLSTDREGFKLDVAGGIVLDFPTQDLEFSRLTKWGAWLTGGYTWTGTHDINWLFVARALADVNATMTNEDGSTTQKDIMNYDFGTRLICDVSEKFSISGEMLYRIVDENNINSSWRYSLNFDYHYRPNQTLSFNVARNLDGVVERGGNLYAALNFIFGIGSRRPVSGQTEN